MLLGSALLLLILVGCEREHGEPAASDIGADPTLEVGPASAVAEDPALSGGETTVFDSTVNAFGLSARNLSAEERRAFFVGNSFFKDSWVTAPASTEGRDGLGPTFNANSCSACHFKDGRAQPPRPDRDEPGLLVRISLPGRTETGAPRPVPHYGDQIQDRAVSGVPAEASLRIEWRERPGRYADGQAYALAEPVYHLEDLAFGPLPADARRSPRIAPVLIGLGLLEAVDEATILQRADPDDADGDGISGRANRVWDVEAAATRLGRFGWKANQPSLRQQNAAAFLGDIGITSDLFAEADCPEWQADCRAALDGGRPEIDAHKLDRVDFYTRVLAVPARRDLDRPEVRRGETLFWEAGCEACHRAAMHTPADAEPAALAGQRIHPYTDLLLHDMGPGLADGREDFEASGSEWRTPPLWGIGLVETVNGHTRFLHDGRARDLSEAILWHGGEAESAKERFRGMSAEDRRALIAFLESL